MAMIGKIRRMFNRQGKSVREISRITSCNLDIIQVREREVRVPLDAGFGQMHNGYIATVFIHGCRPLVCHLQTGSIIGIPGMLKSSLTGAGSKKISSHFASKLICDAHCKNSICPCPISA